MCARAPRERRTSENSVKAKFAEYLFHALRCIMNQDVWEKGSEREHSRGSRPSKAVVNEVGPPRFVCLQALRGRLRNARHAHPRLGKEQRSNIIAHRYKFAGALRLFRVPLAPPGRYLGQLRRSRLSFDLWWGWSLRWDIHRCLQVAFLSLPSLCRMHPCHQSPSVEDGTIPFFK